MGTSGYIWPSFFLLCATITGQVQCQQSVSGTIHYRSYVHHAVKCYFQEPLNFPPSNKIIANYSISYDTTKCCPILGLQRLTGAWENLEKAEFYDECIPDDTLEVSLYNSVFISTQPDLNDECRYEGTRTVCNGSRTLTSVVPVRWGFDAGYEYRSKQNIDVNFEADVKYITHFSSTCEPLELPFCRENFGYNATAFSNAIGQESQKEANQLFELKLSILSRPGVRSCYQHLFLFVCYGLFPACHNNKRLFPCKLLCEDFKAGCTRYLRTIHHIHCDALPDSLDPDVCFYKPVECPVLKSPPFGSAIFEGHLLGNISRYQCNEGYELRGEAVLKCEPSGYWNSSVPTCELPSATGSPPALLALQQTILIASVIAGVFLIVMVMVCMFYREPIKTFIIYNRYNPFGRNIQEQKKLFIAYSSKDRDEVSDIFVPQVREQLHGWTVQTYQDDFTAGRQILDCIKEGVWESQAVLVLLTENFMTSSWCLHEFIEAETRSALEDGFKLIVVMFSRDNQGLPLELIEGLPDSLKKYIRTRVYLALWEPLFWNKMRQALAKLEL